MKRIQRDRQQPAKGQRERGKRGATAPTQSENFEPMTARPQRRVVEPLKAKNARQQKYIDAIKSGTLTFGLGPAGTGKTYLAGCLAAQALLNGDAEKIIVTRPAVDAGESLGFLPGELEDKYAPYIAAFQDVLNERLGKSHVEYLIKTGRIEAQPLAYMRGLTFKNAFVIMDEAQNATPAQMKLFLTRIGENAKVVVNGDLAQKDIPGISGLEEGVRRVSFIPEVRVVTFDSRDIVRSGLCQEIVSAWDNYTPALTPPK